MLITEPGLYRTRCGGLALVNKVGPPTPDTTSFTAKGSVYKMFRGKYRARGVAAWTVNGRFRGLEIHRHDIIAKHEDHP